jgi:hypothetical protein
VLSTRLDSKYEKQRKAEQKRNTANIARNKKGATASASNVYGNAPAPPVWTVMGLFASGNTPLVAALKAKYVDNAIVTGLRTSLT